MEQNFLYDEVIIKKKDGEILKMNNQFSKNFNNNESNISYYKYIFKISKSNNRKNYLIKNHNIIKLEYGVLFKKEKIKIFGDIFVGKNRNKCYIVNEGKKYELVEYFSLKNYKKSKLKIKIIGIMNIINLKKMFYKCNSLVFIKSNLNWGDFNVHDMSYLFAECTSLKSIPAISKLNTTNVNNMSHLFLECSSLISLPDISK